MVATKIAVHKFSSCDGCQLAFLNLGEDLLTLSQELEIEHFLEAGMSNDLAKVDIAFVEGSISTQKDISRIQSIRDNASFLVTMGACATSGGLQALRNMADAKQWHESIYAKPIYIETLSTSTPISEHVKVDFELWGCPISPRQLMWTIRSLMLGATPNEETEKVCLECKRNQNVCVLVTQQQACMGPVTKTGCGALCPTFGRDCYGCFGPAETVNPSALGAVFNGFGLVNKDIKNRFHFINSHATSFKQAGEVFDS